MESYGAMVEAARAGGRAIPELWPLGTEALALAMEVSVLEAKRLGHRAVLRRRLGEKQVKIKYLGNDSTKSSSASVTFTVKKK